MSIKAFLGNIRSAIEADGHVGDKSVVGPARDERVSAGLLLYHTVGESFEYKHIHQVGVAESSDLKDVLGYSFSLLGHIRFQTCPSEDFASHQGVVIREVGISIEVAINPGYTIDDTGFAV